MDDSRARLAWHGLAVLLAVFVYFYGLDSEYIPKNGDEFPYEHITRMTAASGHLLPLQSQLDHMRNTKPPLLFWQGIVSTGWGQKWTQWQLRYPSVIYTLLTAMLVYLLAAKLAVRQGGRRITTGVSALLIYLAFFSTYRYGRPFLVNPPEVFWLFLPLFILVYWQPASFSSRLAVPIALGVATGIGLLYKSFALLAPVGLALTWWYLHWRGYRWREFFVRDAWKPVVAGIIALGLFGLWFVLDPDPQAVWREFIVGENVGKFDPHGGSYLAKLLWGSSSVWALLLGYPMNAGLLAFPVAALFWLAYRRRALVSEAEQLLWIWIIVFFVVFSLPSQRSSRYLLEAMPALAVLCALSWQRIGRAAFVASLAVTAIVLALIAFLAARLQTEIPGGLYPGWFWLVLLVAAALAGVAIVVPRFTRDLSPVVVLLAYLCYAAFLRPFDGAPGNYGVDARQHAQGKAVWVPCDFRAKDEGHRFLLPGAEVHGYDQAADLTPAELAKRYRLFAVQLPLQAEADCAGCKVIGQRIELRSRQSDAEIRAMLKGDVFPHLFAKEVLIESAAPALATPPEGCR